MPCRYADVNQFAGATQSNLDKSEVQGADCDRFSALIVMFSPERPLKTTDAMDRTAGSGCHFASTLKRIMAGAHKVPGHGRQFSLWS
jgi:hypothetical protein